MNRKQKEKVVKTMGDLLEGSHFYITDCEGLNANQMHQLRGMLYEENIQCKLVPNSLLNILLKDTDQHALTEVLKKNSIVFIAKDNPSIPAKVIEKFKKAEKVKKPYLKGAWAYDEVFIGDKCLGELSQLKSKEELIADVIHLLQSPINQVMSALESGKEKLTGIVKALSNK